jgi:hypothetical protein
MICPFIAACLKSLNTAAHNEHKGDSRSSSRCTVALKHVFGDASDHQVCLIKIIITHRSCFGQRLSAVIFFITDHSALNAATAFVPQLCALKM